MIPDNDIPTPKMSEGPGVEARPDAASETQEVHTPLGIRALAPIARKEGLSANFRRFLRFRGTEPGEYFELRALGIRAKTVDVRKIGGAYVADPDRAVALLEEADTSFNAQGIYVSLNRINPAIACRLPGGWHSVENGQMTKDHEIARRVAVLFDMDPDRPQGISATKAENLDALRRAGTVYHALAQNVPEKCLGLGMSGNGGQAYLAVDLDVTPETDSLIASLLQAVDILYSDDRIHVDTSVGNAARICPAFGTKKRKGANHDERPHRSTWFACHDEVTRLNESEVRALLETLESQITPQLRAAHEAREERRKQKNKTAKPQTNANTEQKSKNDFSELWDKVNAHQIREVAAKLGIDPDNPICPWCGQGRSNASQIQFGFKDTNLYKCLHGTCGSKSTNCVGLISKVVGGVDSVRGDREARTKVLDWVHTHLGIDVPKLRRLTAREVDLEQLERDTPLPDMGCDPDPGLELGAEPNVETERHHLTDLGNAQRLIRRHGQDLRYIHAWGKWLVWSGTRWVTDDVGSVMRMAADTVRSIYAEAAAEADPQVRGGIAAWAHTSEAAARIKAMVELARSDQAVAITHEALDADPWLLNVLNGTIDLRMGTLREHRREDLITKLAPVAYGPNAKAPTWERFLERVQPDPEIRAYLGRRAGYGATGIIREHVLYIDYGTGANGKTTWDITLQTVLGDYAVTLPATALIARKGDAHPTELTILFGARYASAAETEAGRGLNVALVKGLTGNDPIVARKMREDFWRFQPTHKLCLATNHKPRISDPGNGIWRRVHLVPWSVTIPEAEQDKALIGKLAEEAPGILAWIVRGCADWRSQGLRPPEAIMAATQAYRDAEDIIGTLLAECVEAAPGERVTREAMREVYESWSRDRGDTHILGSRQFTEGLREHGIVEATPWKSGGRKYRGWADVRLVRHDDDSVTDEYLEGLLGGDGVPKSDAETGATICHPDSELRKSSSRIEICEVADERSDPLQSGRWQQVAAKTVSPAKCIKKPADSVLGATICHPKTDPEDSCVKSSTYEVADEASAKPTDDNTSLTAEEAREALSAALRSAGLADAPGIPVPLSDVPDWLAPAPGIYAAEVLGINEMTGTVDVSYVGRWGRARQRITGLPERTIGFLGASSMLHNGKVRLELRQSGQHIVWPMEIQPLN
jgi:P4 family phage/plasmid primase-like protien